MNPFKIIAKYLIVFYQKYFSIISFGSCRYHPSCSHYALMQFEYNNIFVALFQTITRILKCNQLFDGGFDYPHVMYKAHKCKFKRIRVKYWLVPKGNNKYLVVKNWDSNNKNLG